MKSLLAVLLVLLAVQFIARKSHAQVYSLTPAERAAIEKNCAQYPQARELREKVLAGIDQRLLEGTDDYLLDFLIDPRSKRSLFVHSGDITYGDPIERGGRYMFNKSVDPFEKWTLRSAASGRVFPNEDFPESGPVTADWDEQGWLDTRETVDGEPNPTYGERYYWNAHYAFWFWHGLPDLIFGAASAHIIAPEDDPRKAQTARAAAILLLRVTHAFPETRVEDFRSYGWVQKAGNVGRLMDDIWEPNLSRKLGWAYDFLRDYIRSDETLLQLDFARNGTPFAQDPANDLDGDGEVTTADLLRAIEDKLLRPYIKIWRDKPLNRANATLFQQRALAALAVFLQDHDTYEYSRASLLNHVATNWYFNDGGYYEGSIAGYGKSCVIALRAAVRWLRTFDADLFAPRVIQGHIFHHDLLCQGTWLPNNDDAGGPVLQNAAGVKAGPPLMPMLWEDDEPQGPRFTAIQHLWTDWDEDRWAHLEGAVEGAAPATTVKRAGYAALRTGPSDEAFDLIVTFDPHGGSHTHYDHLGLALYGYGYALTPEMGYPDNLSSPARHQWVNHTLSHWTVTVDRLSGASPFPRGDLKLFHSEPGLQVFRAEAPGRYEGVERYDRTVALIDTPTGGAIVLDRIEVMGGREHLYSFHGAADDGAQSVAAQGGTLGEISPHQTLTGHWGHRPVPYGKPGNKDSEGCVAFLENVRPIGFDGQTLHLTFPRNDAAGTAMDLWMPTGGLRDAYVCEGRTQPTVKKGSVSLPFFIGRTGGLDQEQPQHSVFWAAAEAYQGDPWLEAVTLDEGVLRLKGEDGAELTWAVDETGMTLERDGAARHIEREPVGKVADLDPAARTVTLDAPADLAPGDWLLFENDLGTSTFYPIERILEGNRVVIGDEWTDLTIAHAVLTGKARGRRVYIDPDVVIQYPIRQVAAGGAAKTHLGWVRVESVDRRSVHLEATPHDCERIAEHLAETGGDLLIVDIAPGDQVIRFAATARP